MELQDFIEQELNPLTPSQLLTELENAIQLYIDNKNIMLQLKCGVFNCLGNTEKLEVMQIELLKQREKLCNLENFMKLLKYVAERRLDETGLFQSTKRS